MSPLISTDDPVGNNLASSTLIPSSLMSSTLATITLVPVFVWQTILSSR
jgi:hypothetical protein